MRIDCNSPFCYYFTTKPLGSCCCAHRCVMCIVCARGVPVLCPWCACDVPVLCPNLGCRPMRRTEASRRGWARRSCSTVWSSNNDFDFILTSLRSLASAKTAATATVPCGLCHAARHFSLIGAISTVLCPKRGYRPVNITEPHPGVFVVDFGVNLAGVCKLSNIKLARGVLLTRA